MGLFPAKNSTFVTVAPDEVAVAKIVTLLPNGKTVPGVGLVIVINGGATTEKWTIGDTALLPKASVAVALNAYGPAGRLLTTNSKGGAVTTPTELELRKNSTSAIEPFCSLASAAIKTGAPTGNLVPGNGFVIVTLGAPGAGGSTVRVAVWLAVD